MNYARISDALIALLFEPDADAELDQVLDRSMTATGWRSPPTDSRDSADVLSPRRTGR
jgi:hypothetical protein